MYNKNPILWCHDLVISQIWFFDIIKSIFFNKKFWLRWWYHKIIYVISKNRICDITKWRWFLISKHIFCDITKYVDFLIDEMVTPVFYLCYFFYVPADTKFRASALIIFGSYHYSKELKGKNDSWYLRIALFISQNHNDHNQFLITQNQFFDITNSILWCQKIYCVIS